MTAYRQKQKVLCLYEAKIRTGNSTRSVQDSVMVEVEFSDQIADAFKKSTRQSIGRNVIDVELVKYIPECGRQNF